MMWRAWKFNFYIWDRIAINIFNLVNSFVGYVRQISVSEAEIKAAITSCKSKSATGFNIEIKGNQSQALRAAIEQANKQSQAVANSVDAGDCERIIIKICKLRDSKCDSVLNSYK